MRIDNTVFVGLSARTNSAGLSQLANHLEPLGYRVQSTVFHGCLHLKSACTCIGRNTVLANRDHIEVSQLNGLAIVDVDPDEPDAGNALIIGGTVIMPASFPATVARLRRRGFEVQTLDVSELQKAEAGVTCCSILFEVTAG